MLTLKEGVRLAPAASRHIFKEIRALGSIAGNSIFPGRRMTMATASLRSRRGAPSPLAVDLALARVDLAALRARRGQELDERAQDAAGLLKQHYSRKLQRATSPVPVISETLVPDEETRQALRKGLASIAKGEPEFAKADEELVNRLIELLSALAQPGRFEPEHAKELHSLLHTLEAKRPASVPTHELSNPSH